MNVTRLPDEDLLTVSNELGSTRHFKRSDIKSEDVQQQQEIIDERHKNMAKVTTVVQRINEISNEMKSIIYRQERRLDEFHKRQVRIEDDGINALREVIEASNSSRFNYKKIVMITGVLILIAIAIMLIVYFVFFNGRNEEKEKKISGLAEKFCNFFRSYFWLRPLNEGFANDSLIYARDYSRISKNKPILYSIII